MHRVGLLLLSLLAFLVLLPQGHAADASDQYLQAWQQVQAAEKIESEGRIADALEKYKAAARVLEKISQDSPDWQPLVVEYRLRKTREAVTRLESQAATLPAGGANPEGPLPEADRSSGLPEVSSAPLTSSSSRRTVETGLYSSPEGDALPDSNDLRTLRRQIGDLKRQNSQLSERLLNRTAELQSARMEIDRTKVTVVELKAQLAQVRDALDDAQKDQTSEGSQRKGVEAQVAALQQSLADAQADNEVLTEENSRLFAKLDQAAKYIESSDSIRVGLLKERKDLAEERDKAVARTKKIKDNSAAMEKLAAENASLTEKLKEAQRDPGSKKTIDKLTAEKSDLESKYAEMEKQLQAAVAAAPEKDKLLTSLQGELNSVNDKLLEAQSQMTRSQDQIRDLQRQLDETSGELAKVKINGPSGKDQQNMLAENELLRGIILRQIKDQTSRDEAKKALEAEIAALQIKSDVISKQVAVLGAPILDLTPEERSLFKEPMALLNEPNAQSMQITMAMTKPEGQGMTASSQGPDSLPENVRALVDKAKALFGEKNYLEAEKVYQQIVEEVPDNYFALSNLGAVQIEAGKMSAAEVALKRAIEINPGDAFAYKNLGIAYSRQGKFSEAVACLRQALAVNDSDAVAHNYLGVCLGQLENPTEAEQELKRAIELKEDYPEAHFNLAVLYATGQPPSLDLAKLHYNKATQLGAQPDPSLERLIQ